MQPKPSTFAVGILICMICLLLGACQSEKSDISMSVTPNKFDKVPASINLTIVNESDTTAQYGAYYTIEKDQEGEWIRMPFNDQLAFIDLLYIQEPKETRKYDISLYPDLGEYKKGKYRIKKNVSLGDKNMDLTAEFEVK